MKSNMIYHYVNQFDAHFLMFKYRKLHQVIILGPFLLQRPSENKCLEMLQEVQIKHSKLTILKQYLLQIPVCQYSQALNMTHLAVRYLKIEIFIIVLKILILAFIVTQNHTPKIRHNMNSHLIRLKNATILKIEC